ncbi:MAG TPA: hypothetical protein VKY31_05485 [Terriglobia bacterium]|nr:hypothetical protein [Terriglobia bacterium]
MMTDRLNRFSRIMPLIVSLAPLIIFPPAASPQNTTATPLAPAVIQTDASGNLLSIERRAANSIPGASPAATGLVTRIIVVPPQNGANPSTAVYTGTMDNFYLGKRALYSILTVTTSGKTTKYLAAIDGGPNGVLPASLPSTAVTISGTSDIRVIPANANKDAIYIVQTPVTVRRSGTTTTTTSTARTVTIVEYDGTAFSTPRSITVQ